MTNSTKPWLGAVFLGSIINVGVRLNEPDPNAIIK